MVKKLLKHEFIYYFRTFGLFLPIVLVVGAMTRIFMIFDNGKIINDIIIGFSIITFVVSCAALMILSTVIGIVRFYKNMYSAEGYLTFTLPVTNAQHIFVKLFVAVVFQTVCLLTVVISGCIVLSGKELIDMFRDIMYAMQYAFNGIGAVNMIVFIIEMIIMMLLSVASNMLLYYACITIGQTAKKNRILMAIGVYFIYYIITQVISTIFTIIITMVSMSDALVKIVEWIANYPIPAMHILFGVSVIISAAITALFWFVTQRIMTKKLNLE